MNKIFTGVLGVGLLGSIPLSAGAAGTDNINISGFLTAGATYASQPVLSGTSVVSGNGTIGNVVSFEEDSRFGLQVSAQVNPEVSITGQMLAKARENGYALSTDWAYVKYRANNNLSIRAGRVKLPSFLISDYNEVGYAYPWVRPPQEMYSANPMTGVNGIDMLLRYNMGDLGLLIQPFYGNNTQETTVPQAIVSSGAPLCLGAPGGPPPTPVNYVSCPAGTVVNVPFSVEGLHGINLNLSNDSFTLRASWFKTQVYQSNFGVAGDEGSFSSVGLTMDVRNIVFYTEGFVRVVEGTAGMAFPNQEGGYATLGYRFGKFMPHATYGWLDHHLLGATSLTQFPLMQRSVALGLRYELGRGAAFKFEALRVTPEPGTTGLLIADPNAVTSPYRNESVMFYSAAVDVVF